MSNVQIGVIGVGSMGIGHARRIFEQKVSGASLVAVCDLSNDHLEKAKEEFGDQVLYYSNVQEFLNNNTIDAVLIATPHYSHVSLGIEALEKGKHILVEKPVSVTTLEAKKLNEVANNSDKAFALMFQQRTQPIYKKAKQLLTDGEVGPLKRINWIITDWYRPQAYYDSGSWRATWKGEGGGVLLNQCPHNLDMLQWLCGMPEKLRAFCHFGKYHDIEVEDEVNCYLEYKNGATGSFVTSTGETPGTNRLEIIGDKGKIVIENDELVFYKNEQSERIWNQNNIEAWGKLEHTTEKFTFEEKVQEHLVITQNWVDAISNNAPLIAPGQEGINSLRLSNAMYLSTWLNKEISMDYDESLFHQLLQDKINSNNEALVNA